MNTRDLMDFGPRERKIAAKLLLLFRSPNDNTKRLGEFVSVEFNPISKCVFLVDIQFRVAREKGDFLEDWYICPTCKEEGFKETLSNGKSCCKESLNSSAIAA